MEDTADTTPRSRQPEATTSGLLVGLLTRVHNWMSRPGIPLGEEYFEIYAMTNYAMTLGLISHICFIGIFWFVGAPVLALYNILSVIAFSAAVILARRAYFVTSLTFAALEVVVHAWLATIWLGLFIFAHLFIPLALQLVVLLTPVARRARIAAAVAIGLAYLALAFVGIRFSPLVALPLPTVIVLAVMNVFIYLVVATGMAVYYSWTVQVTRGARIKAEGDLQVARDQAIAALDEAKQANQAKSTFLANMSHELRTPLNAIIGYSEMIADDTGEEETRNDAHKIEGSGRHLLSLINEILDLSKIEAGRMDIAFSHFVLDECVAPVVDAVRPLAEKGGNTLEVTIEDPSRDMHSDLMKVRQILLNLLSNACKFTQSGTVSLQIIGREIGGTPSVRMIVSDTGIGISKEALDKIFLAFVQAEISTSERYGGTGLGLALTKTLCELLGGDITATSEVGKGSTFVVTLPAVCPHASGPAPQDDPHGGPRQPAATYSV